MSAEESITSLPDAVAALGALPVPVGPEPQASDVAAEQLDFLHRVTLPDLRREVQHHQDGKARWRERAETAEARVAELEAELAVANGVLDDAAQARRDGTACPCPSVDRTHQVGCPEDGVPVATLREPDGEFHGALHHTYRVSHDMPETGGAK